MTIVKKLICYECALEKSGDELTALGRSAKLREKVLTGWNVTCSECEGVKSIWKSPWKNQEKSAYIIG